MAADAKVVVETLLDDREFNRGLGGIKTSLKDLKREDGKFDWSGLARGSEASRALSASLVETGGTLTAGLTVPLVAAGAAAVATASGFDDAMAQVKGALGDPQADMEALRDLALDLGASTVFSATEAGQAMVELAKGGMTEAQIKGGALQASMDLAAAGSMELADAANATVQAMGAFGLSAGDAGSIADALAGAANASSADVSDLTQALSQCAAQAKLSGWSIQDTAAALALFADHGIKGSDAGTSLKTMLQRLAAPTDESARAMEELGLSAYDAEGRFRPMAQIAQEMRERLGGLSEAQRNAALQTIFGSDASRAAQILMESGADGLAKYTAATNDSTAAESMAAAQKGSLSWALEELSGSVETLAIRFGDKLAPFVEAAAGAISAAADAFSNLDDGVQTAIVGVAALLAALGPVLMVAGGFLAVLPGIVEGAGVLGAALGIAAPAAEGAAVGLGGMVGAALPFVAAIGAVVAALVYCWNTSESFRDSVTASAESIAASVGSAWERLQPYVQAAADILAGTLIPLVQSAAELVGGVFAAAFSTAAGLIGAAMQVITGAVQVAVGTIETVVGVFVGVFTSDWSMAASGAESVMNGLSSVLAGIMNGIASGIEGALNIVGSAFSGTFNLVMSTVSGAMDSVANAIDDRIGGAKRIVSDGLRNISGFFSSLKLEFPKIKLPHFSVSGSFSLNPPSVPTLGIDWYATGGYFDKPSIIGVGEKGGEHLLNEHHIDALAERIGGSGARASDELLAEAVAELRAVRAFLEGMALTTDTGAVIATFAPDMERELAKRAGHAQRHMNRRLSNG